MFVLCGCADGLPMLQDGPVLAQAGNGDAVVAPALPLSETAQLVQGPYLLDTGDKLRIFVYGRPNLSRGYTVEHDGSVSVPLIGRVKARGRTIKQLEGTIATALGKEYIRDPHVTVDMMQNRPFFILGEVKTAGQYPYVSGMTIETAVAIAGGYSERASDQSFRVTRNVGGTLQNIDVPPDFALWPGDTVYVRERYF